MGLNEDFFEMETKLQIRITGLWLEDHITKEQAVLALYACDEEIIRPFIEKSGPFTTKISGIECEQPNITRAKQLYAKIVDEKGHLLALSQKIVVYFVERGLIKRDTWNKIIKLRMELINTNFLMRKVKDQDDPKMENIVYHETKFDATKILQEFKDAYFGKITLSSINLSIRGDTDTQNGYKSAVEINL
ncbi:uncharacterized protein LOC117180650 [Belonocnema kinseyi]|uniref:uncharacterized protein LOC117180650 n=1 Tax=Belonocnema kinseyi TaxID=2817044 RepID=UPI00143D99BA|nr:uncharacterized protein LOC117180650 [Belonocnema kinseyi]